MELSVLIVDDEPGIRLLLRKWIKKTAGFTLVGEAEDGETALRLATLYQPELIFLDVEMPGLNGLECARRIRELNQRTCFVFATAHEGYMSEAFQVYATDYLLKPFKMERLHQTLERIREAVRRERPAESAGPAVLPGRGLDKLLIRNKEGINLVDLDDIILIQREERLSVIYTSEHRFATSETLGDLEQRLDQTRFFRSHKSYIINLAMIEKISLYGRWTYLVKLKKSAQDALRTAGRYAELEKLINRR